MSDDVLEEAAQEQPEDQTDEEESFAELFESYAEGMNEDVRVGDKVKGAIISIGRDSVFVDTGTRTDGFVEKSELLDEEGQFTFKEGDILELYAVAVTGTEIRLSKAITGIGGAELLRDAFENAIPVEGRVKAVIKGGFQVEVVQRRAFCPISQMDLRYVETPEEYMDQAYEFLITEFDEDGRNIVLSRRKLLNRALEKVRESFYAGLTVGDLMEGRVTKLMPFGAFVELTPGVEGMIHISELGWSRVENPDEVIHVGESVRVKVIGMEPSEKSDQLKIALSIKQTLGDPWETVDQRYNEGDTVPGKVTRCLDFGAFVEVEPGIEGLVHISEMSYRRRISKPEDVVSPGEQVQVMIKEMDKAKRRISLSIRDVEGDPWAGVAERYRVGQSVNGTVEKQENFGVFVSLEPGVTALLPKSTLRETSKPVGIEKMRPGDPITVVIQRISAGERKITVGPGDEGDEGDWRNFSSGKGAAVSSLGEKLMEALQSKKKK
jgi:small subunit ribosomal protein S1